MKNYYLTYNEFNKGVYKSQVIDTLNHYHSLGSDITLVSLLPMRNYLRNRRWVKKNYKNSIVLPAIPTLTLMIINCLYLIFLDKKSNIICRGSLATNIALYLRLKFRKIILDSRSAIAEEHYEYGNKLKYQRLLKIEKKAINNSDFQISISNELIVYWSNKFSYKKNTNVIIPCCTTDINNSTTKIISKTDDPFFNKIVIVFSGSTHPWQSFELNSNFLKELLSLNNNINVLFLSKMNTKINELIITFGSERVRQKWVNPSEVKTYLSLCDYGLLLRDNNITNNVSSPVKFAEYLECGLNIIISSSIIDYAKFIEKNKCGLIWNSGDEYPVLIKNNDKNRLENISLANNFFKRGSPSQKHNINKILALL